MTKIREKKSNPTELDRAMEEYSVKVLQGRVQDEDTSEYQRLLITRTNRLVKLPSARAMRAARRMKHAG